MAKRKQPQLQAANQKWNSWLKAAQKREGISRQEAINAYRTFKDALGHSPTQAEGKRYRGLFRLDREAPRVFPPTPGRRREAPPEEPEEFFEDQIIEVDLEGYEEVPA